MSKISNFYYLLATVKNWPLALFTYLGLAIEDYATLRLRNGLQIKIRTKTSDLHEVVAVLSGRDYPAQFILPYLRKEAVIVNIGAHIGTFDLFVNGLCENCHLYDFEPERSNYELLKVNLELNNIRNVNLNNMAVSDQDGWLQFAGEETYKNEFHSDAKGGVRIKTIKLDTFIEENQIDGIDLLKMDCEGSEYDILPGFNGIFKCSAIMMEYHLMGSGKAELNVYQNDEFLIHLLLKCGFRLSYHLRNHHLKSGILFFENENRKKPDV